MNTAQKNLLLPIIYLVIAASAYYGFIGNEFVWNFFLLTQWFTVIFSVIMLSLAVITSTAYYVYNREKNGLGEFKQLPELVKDGMQMRFDILFDMVMITLLAMRGYLLLAILVFVQVLILQFIRIYFKLANEALEADWKRMQTEANK